MCARGVSALALELRAADEVERDASEMRVVICAAALAPPPALPRTPR